MEELCIVITGLLEENYIEPLINTYKNINTTKIISTWNDQNEVFINKLKDNGFTILLNDYPQFRTSTNLQIKNAYMGCLKANELNYKYVMRTRTDLISENLENVFDKIKHLYQDKLCVLARIEEIKIQYKKKFFVDHIVFGPINNMLKFYGTEKDLYDNRFTEQFLQENYIGKTPSKDGQDIEFEEFTQYFNLCLKEFREAKIKMTWLRGKYTYYGHNIDFINGHYCHRDSVRYNLEWINTL
jgi:hypothetical protein